MPRVLALDTATPACTLAVFSEGSVRARHELLARAHNRHILGMLAEVLEGESLESVGRRIFEEILAVASGKKTKSEKHGIGYEEFIPWVVAPML